MAVGNQYQAIRTPLLFGFSLLLHIGGLLAYDQCGPEPSAYVSLAVFGGGTVLSEDGSLYCGERCVTTLDKNTVMALTAIADKGMRFVGYSDGCKKSENDNHRCTFLAKERHKIVARFIAKKPQTVTLLSKGKIEALQAKKKKRRRKKLVPTPKLAQPAEKPEKPKQENKTEQAVKVVPREKIDMQNLKTVEIDTKETTATVDDAQFLSDKNRDVEQQTRAENTNLSKSQKGDEASSQQSTRQDKTVGGEENTIAELSNKEATSLSAETTDQQKKSGQEGTAPAQAGQQGRDTLPKSRQKNPLDTRNLPQTGSLATPNVSSGLPGISTPLTSDFYERIAGSQKVRQEQEIGRQRASNQQGRYTKRLGAIQSALENFIPEVQTGNQTALKTRAAPFAVYIARMHRKIHPLWGFGFLDDMDEKSSSHPLNDFSLRTVLEVVIASDGSVDKVTVTKNSGRLEFDVAAIDAVQSAGPYEAPPSAILSPNGKAYIHWGFYRNYRQCGTFNANPFILAETSQKTPSSSGLPLNKAGAAKRGTTKVPNSSDRAVQFAANKWITGFTKGRIDKLLQVSKTPFLAGSTLTIQTKRGMQEAYENLLQESRDLRDWVLLSPAQYRKRIGALPQGLVDSAAILLTITTKGGRFVIVLRPNAKGEYAARGIYR